MKNTIIAIVSLLVLLTVCFYGYEFIFKKPLVESPTDMIVDNFNIPTLDIKQQYKDSAYTLVGEIELPTLCHSLETQVSPNNSGVYEIIIKTITPKEGVVCAEVITPKPFKVSVPVTTNEIPVFKIFVDGIEYNMNIFEIPADQNIDTYKLEFKG